MNLHSTDFELFATPATSAFDRAALDVAWRALQAKVHPDKFVAEGAAAQRVAMQWAVRVNEAYQRLQDPLRRATYLCELNGEPINAENNTAMPTPFLIQQMEWREALDDAHALSAVKALASEVATHRKASLADLQITIDEKQDYAAAAQQIRALMFMERFEADVDRRLEALGH